MKWVEIFEAYPEEIYRHYKNLIEPILDSFGFSCSTNTVKPYFDYDLKDRKNSYTITLELMIPRGVTITQEDNNILAKYQKKQAQIQRISELFDLIISKLGKTD